MCESLKAQYTPLRSTKATSDPTRLHRCGEFSRQSDTFVAYDDLVRTSQITLWWLAVDLFGPRQSTSAPSPITLSWLVVYLPGLQRSPSAPVRLSCDDLSWAILARPHQSDHPVMTCRTPSWSTTIPIRTSQITLWWLVVHLLGLRRSPSAPVRLPCDDLSYTFLVYDDPHPHQSYYPVMTCRAPSWPTTIHVSTQSDYPVMTCCVPSWPTTIPVRTS